MLARMSNCIAKAMFRACAALFAASVVLAAIRTTAQQPFPKPLRGEDVDPEFQLEDPQGDWVRPIGEIGTWIAPSDGEGGIPFDHAGGYFNREPVIEGAAMASRPWLAFSYCWTAPSICHRPLYFEEPNLERYGHSAGCLLQPAISGRTSSRTWQSCRTRWGKTAATSACTRWGITGPGVVHRGKRRTCASSRTRSFLKAWLCRELFF